MQEEMETNRSPLAPTMPPAALIDYLFDPHRNSPKQLVNEYAQRRVKTGFHGNMYQLKCNRDERDNWHAKIELTAEQASMLGLDQGGVFQSGRSEYHVYHDRFEGEQLEEHEGLVRRRGFNVKKDALSSAFFHLFCRCFEKNQDDMTLRSQIPSPGWVAIANYLQRYSLLGGEVDDGGGLPPIEGLTIADEHKFPMISGDEDYVALPSTLNEEAIDGVCRICPLLGLRYARIEEEGNVVALVSNRDNGFDSLDEGAFVDVQSLSTHDYPPYAYSHNEDLSERRRGVDRYFAKESCRDQADKILGLASKIWSEKDLRNAPRPTGHDVLVDTEPLLKSCRQTLKESKIIGLDVEALDKRTCLLQLTAVSNDGERKHFIIDVLAVWKFVHDCLSDVLGDPKIIKVGHGMRSLDIKALFFDFGLVIINCIDLQECHSVLNPGAKPIGLVDLLLKHGLEERVEREVFGDKDALQTADWTRRPLSQKELGYAQADTHYLPLMLFPILSKMKEKGDGLILKALQKSAKVCKMVGDDDQWVKDSLHKDILDLTYDKFSLGHQLWGDEHRRVYQALVVLRSAIARARRIRANDVASLRTLACIAILRPQSSDEIQRFRPFSPSDVTYHWDNALWRLSRVLSPPVELAGHRIDDDLIPGRIARCLPEILREARGNAPA